MDDLLGDRIFWYTVTPLLGPSLACLVLIDTEAAAGNTLWKYSVLLFFPPMFLGGLVLAAHALPRKPSPTDKLLRVFGAFSVAAIYSLLCTGYLLLANVLTGSPQPVLVSGPVTEMKAESGRYTGKLHNITVHYDDRDIKLTVTPQEFVQLRVGEVYSREMKLGGLGYYYTWGLAFWK